MHKQRCNTEHQLIHSHCSVSGFFAPLPFRPLALSPLADLPPGLFAFWFFHPWLIRRLCFTFASWLVRPLADSPSRLGRFVLWLIRPLAF